MANQLNLGLNFEDSNDHLAHLMADEDVETGEHSNWDHAYECAWNIIDDEDASLYLGEFLTE